MSSLHLKCFFCFFEFQLTSHLSTYILRNKQRFFDERNIKIAIVRGSLLGYAFGVNAFHRCQLNSLLMRQLIPYNSNNPPDGTAISREDSVKRAKNEIDERKNIENTCKMEPENQKVYELLAKQIQEKESQLKCPVCYETVSSPIFMCQQMQHLICSSCRARLTKCPECRENYDHIPRRH